MVPGALHVLASFPRTSTQKVDRKALVAQLPALQGATGSRGPVGPGGGQSGGDGAGA